MIIDNGTQMRLTIGRLFDWLTDGQVSEALLDWAPDVAALTGALIERTHAFRFVVAPPPDWFCTINFLHKYLLTCLIDVH